MSITNSLPDYDLLPRKCPICGKTLYPTEVGYGAFKIRVVPRCHCEIEEYERQEQARLKAEKRARIEQIFKRSRMGERYRACRFDNFVREPRYEGIFVKCYSYATDFSKYAKKGEGITLFGGVGTGKTHLAAAIANYLMFNGVTVVFQSVPDLLARFRGSFSGNQSETQIRYALESADLLVLDDLGAEYHKGVGDWSESIIQSIIEYRYSHMMPIVATTNCNPKELVLRIGERAVDRLISISPFILMDGPSWRKKLAKLL